jgi:hypothetical protein
MSRVGFGYVDRGLDVTIHEVGSAAAMNVNVDESWADVAASNRYDLGCLGDPAGCLPYVLDLPTPTNHDPVG